MSSSNGHTQHRRQIAHERAFTAAAAAMIERSPAPITSLAESRAPLEPLRDFPWRDFGLDTLEELADARNYIVWLALRLDVTNRVDTRGRAARLALHEALAHIVAAFAKVDLARRLSGVESHLDKA